MTNQEEPKLQLLANLTATYAARAIETREELSKKYGMIKNPTRKGHKMLKELYARDLFPAKPSFGHDGTFYRLGSYEAGDDAITFTFDTDLDIGQELVKDGDTEKYHMGREFERLKRSRGDFAVGTASHRGIIRGMLGANSYSAMRLVGSKSVDAQVMVPNTEGKKIDISSALKSGKVDEKILEQMLRGLDERDGQHGLPLIGIAIGISKVQSEIELRYAFGKDGLKFLG